MPSTMCGGDASPRYGVGPVVNLGPGSGVIQVVATDSMSFAVKADGSVWAWGWAGNGPFGQFSPVADVSTPVMLPSFGPGSGVVEVASDGSVAWARREDGSVWAWGYGGIFQARGDGQDAPSTYEPAMVVGMASGVVDLSEQVMVKSDGSVWAWSYNFYGQVGDGTYEVRRTPVRVLEFHSACDGLVFLDMKPGGSFCGEVSWLVDEGIVNGFGDGTFRPGEPITRQALAAFLWRLAGKPESEPGAPSFTDVQSENPFAEAIGWLAGEGITNGFGDGSFRPAAPITRQAMAAFLYRYSGLPLGHQPPCGNDFFDVSAHNDFCGEITWLVAEGITNGFGDGSFRPAAPITRQAMAAFLHRMAT